MGGCWFYSHRHLLDTNGPVCCMKCHSNAAAEKYHEAVLVFNLVFSDFNPNPRKDNAYAVADNCNKNRHGKQENGDDTDNDPSDISE